MGITRNIDVISWWVGHSDELSTAANIVAFGLHQVLLKGYSQVYILKLVNRKIALCKTTLNCPSYCAVKVTVVVINTLMNVQYLFISLNDMLLYCGIISMSYIFLSTAQKHNRQNLAHSRQGCICHLIKLEQGNPLYSCSNKASGVSHSMYNMYMHKLKT